MHKKGHFGIFERPRGDLTFQHSIKDDSILGKIPR